jgi:hypothetical protein
MMNANQVPGWRVRLTAAADKAGLTTAARTGAQQRYQRLPSVPVRVPLTAGQHILHLLLTVLTGGLWAPVWFVRAMQGNRARG